MTEKMVISGGKIIQNPYPDADTSAPEAESVIVEQVDTQPKQEQRPTLNIRQSDFVRDEPIQQKQPEQEKPKDLPLGYMTREEYIARKGTDEGYKTPEEFKAALETSPWLRKERIETLENTVKKQNEELAKVADLMRKQYEAGKKAALDEIQKKQFDAIQQGDQAAWAQLEQQKQDVIAQKPEFEAPQQPQYQQPQQIPPELVQWKAQNPWFGADIQMTQEAIMISDELSALAPYAPPTQIAAEVERRIKSKYASKFGLPTGQQNSFISKGSSAVTEGKKTYSLNDLTPEDRQLATKWRKFGYTSQEAYVKDILKTYE